MIGNNFRKLGAQMIKLRRIEEGFSLIELMISVALFSIIILSATQIFKLVVDGQRGAIATQNVEESLKYFSEVTGKEMRMAQKNSDSACLDIPNDKIFVVTNISSTSDTLIFQNRYGQCVSYRLGVDPVSGQQRFVIQRNSDYGWITPAKIKMDALHFIINDDLSKQPIVTVNLRAHATNQAQFQSSMTIQTSITSRYYK